MHNSTGGIIITLTTFLCLSIIPFANAQTPYRSRDSQILPYLLDNPHDNPTVKVRCLPRERQEVEGQRRIIRESLLQSNSGDRHNTVTIEIEGNCRNVRIRVPGEEEFSYPPNYHPSEFDEDWLTRKGSGWHWLLHHR